VKTATESKVESLFMTKKKKKWAVNVSCAYKNVCCLVLKMASKSVKAGPYSVCENRSFNAEFIWNNT
jgi:hypothetical protein